MIRAWLTYLSFGPYHLSRLNACEKIPGFRFLPVSMAKNQSEYGWNLETDSRIQFVEPERYLESIRGKEWNQKLRVLLRNNRPDVVFIAGYSHPAMLSLIVVCGDESIPWILMSDSRAVDAPRRRWQEATKERIVRLASSGFVAGNPHAEYLKSLGMPEDRISQGYDVVDNQFFRERANDCRQVSDAISTCNYFLASNRFIEKKNLLRLVTAYSLYAKSVPNRTSGASDTLNEMPMRPLVLLGDGPMKPKIEAHCQSLGIEIVSGAPWEKDRETFSSRPTVFLPGFRQLDELPRFYSQAIAFIHASTVDQWGLVVNEAMASGLPVLVSRGCGCAPDLVQNEMNGWTFDPFNEDELADQMIRVAAMSQSKRTEMSIAGQRIIERWGPDRFAKGCKESAECAIGVGPRKPSFVDRLLLSALVRR
jgi:glycosyltransferase involved in cell wall biosynthesis